MADPDPDPKDPPDPEPDPKDPPDDIEKMRTALAKANDEAKRYRLEANEGKKAKADLETLRKNGMSESEKAIAEAKAEARKEALAESTARLVRTEIKAAAAGKFADPADAHAFLGDPMQFVDKDGEVDDKALTKAIDDVLKAKPYLAAGGRPGALPGGGGKQSDSVDMNAWIRQQAGITAS